MRVSKTGYSGRDRNHASPCFSASARIKQVIKHPARRKRGFRSSRVSSICSFSSSSPSKAAAGGGSAKPRPSESRYEKLSVFDLVPSEDNFYSMREIGELKAAIEIAGKVLQNLVVVPLGDGKYKVIAGHRRRLASIELVNGGKPEYEFVPCVIEPENILKNQSPSINSLRP